MRGFKYAIKKTLYTAGMCTCFLFFSCAGLPVSSFFGSEKVLTNFMPSGNLQYYIRPGKMISSGFKTDKAFVLLDFTYQKSNRDYVSDAYTNFTITYKTTAFVKAAYFKINDNKIIPLTNISLLFRNVKQNHIRVSTVLPCDYIDEVLKRLESSQAVLEIEFDDGSIKTFLPTKDLTERLTEAFSK